jgi:hypothetical protein
MMEAVSTSETSDNFYQTTRRNTPEHSRLHTRRHENLVSHKNKSLYSSLRPILQVPTRHDFTDHIKCNPLSTVVSICTICFNIHYLFILLTEYTQCIYGFHMILRINSDYFLKQHLVALYYEGTMNTKSLLWTQLNQYKIY